jgi:glycosyltransferase involved in cell wall biosynthesis
MSSVNAVRTAGTGAGLEPSLLAGLGVVVIGRNEGERLLRCLDSLRHVVTLVVYVDSGSTDASVQHACQRGCEVVELDMSRPFTAARARNAGLSRLREKLPDARFVQFVDGDCQLRFSWLQTAYRFLDERPYAAAVFGRQRERHPLRSIYNQLCDYEWRVPPGTVKAFAGNVMVREMALRDAGGYREDLIAGEEPELCVRLRALGWSIHSLDSPMSVHDAGILRFDQWWLRTKRTGYAFAQGAHLHGHEPECHYLRESRRAWLWGVGLPAAVLLATLVWSPWALLAGIAYPLQVLRLALTIQGDSRERWIKAYLYTLARFPEAAGQLMFLRDRWSRRTGHLIEYK